MHQFHIERLESRSHFAGGGAADSVSTRAADLKVGIEVEWTRAATTPIDGYRVFRATHGREYVKVAEVTGQSYQDEDIRYGTTYAYRVRRFTRVHGSTATLGRDIYHVFYSPHDTEMGVDVEGDGTVNVYGSVSNWNVDNFRVQWAPVGEPFSQDKMEIFPAYPPGGDLLTGAFGGTLLTGLTSKRYNFVLFPLSSEVPSWPTGILTITMLPNPTNLQASHRTSQSVRLSWSSDAVAATGSRIKWREVGSDVVHSKRIPAGRRHTVIDELQSGVTYRFDVSTLRGENESDRATIVESV